MVTGGAGVRSFTVEFPPYFDDHAAEIEAKGYFADLAVRLDDAVLRPTFYDPVRFRQECEDTFSTGAAYVSGPLLVLVPAVTRAGIMAALDALAAGGFRDLLGPGRALPASDPRPA